jgi:hypothetical protein
LNNRVPWVRVVAEAVAIVVSILLAFGIQAWWDGLQDRARERLTLRSLVAATEANLQRVDSAIAYDSISNERMARALNLVRSGQVPIPDSVALMVWRGAWYSDFHPLTAAYSTSAASGELLLVQNDQIRARIVEVGGELSGVEQQIRTYDQAAGANWQSLISFYDAVGAQNAFEASEGRFGATASAVPQPVHRRTWADRQASPDFEARLFSSWVVSVDRLALLRDVRDYLATLRAQLDAELGS